MLKDNAGVDDVTKLPARQIGQAVGVYVITGKMHKEAAAELQERLNSGMTLAQEIVAAEEIEEEYQVAIDIEY